MQFSWPLMLTALGGLLIGSLLVGIGCACARAAWGRAPTARDLALEIARRELERLRPGMTVVDRLEIVPVAEPRRLAW